MTRDEIKYLALQELGYTKEPDFSADDDNAVNAINNQYEHIYNLSLVCFPWHFAHAFAKAETEATTNKRFEYVSLVPSDCIFLRGVYADNVGTTIDDYYLDDRYVYTNKPDVFLDYTRKVCENRLPAYFVEFLKYSLAAKLSQSLTGDTNLLQLLAMRQQEAYAIAKNADITQRPVRFLDTDAFIKVRF